MVQSLVRGHSATSLGLLAPADRTPESFTRGAYRFFDHKAREEGMIDVQSNF